ncbi:unnamed protein product [Closterium sp. NIES-54]
MAVDATAIVASVLAEASPGGVPGGPKQALHRAASALAGRGTSSCPSREWRAQQRRSHAPVYRPPPGRTPACLRPRRQQAFRRTQRQLLCLPQLGLRPLPLQHPSSPLSVPVERAPSPPLPPLHIPAPLPVRVFQEVASQRGPSHGVRLSRRQRQRQSRQLTPLPPPTLLQPLQMSPPPLPPSPPSFVQLDPPPALSPGEISSSSTPPPRGTVPSGSSPPTCQGAHQAQAPQHRWGLWEDSPPVGWALREQEEAVAAAMEMLRMLPAIGLVPGSPGSALGAGSLRRLALAALQSPRDIVPAAASVLRWMDGRLCWILAE